MFRVHIPRCTHIKTNGTQCGSPALRGRRYCHFHKNWREQRVRLNAKRAGRPTVTLPVLEDADSIQVALMQILRLILAGQIESKTAGLLLYGLQTASLNLRQMQLDPLNKQRIVVRPEWTSQTGVGDDAWCEEDFDDEDADTEDESDEEAIAEDTEYVEDAESEGTIAASPIEEERTIEESDGDGINRKANQAQRTARAARPRRSRQNATPKRSRRTRCTDPYGDDGPSLARYLLDTLNLPPHPSEKKPPMSEPQEDTDAHEKNDIKKLSS